MGPAFPSIDSTSNDRRETRSSGDHSPWPASSYLLRFEARAPRGNASLTRSYRQEGGCTQPVQVQLATQSPPLPVHE